MPHSDWGTLGKGRSFHEEREQRRRGKRDSSTLAQGIGQMEFRTTGPGGKITHRPRPAGEGGKKKSKRWVETAIDKGGQRKLRPNQGEAVSVFLSEWVRGTEHQRS